MATAIYILIGAILASWVIIALAYHRVLARTWAEPVLRHPVLIIESDDWGPGPETDAHRLRAVMGVLRAHRDSTGRHPVMTLGLVLSVPDTAAMAESGLARYERLTLDDPRFRAIGQAIREGCDVGVFSRQLHGMEHFWPPTLMRQASADAELRSWLTGTELPDAYTLPAHLQSRWVDATVLPTEELKPEAIRAAVVEETETFGRVFGESPQVAVPPTFVWTPAVESAWAERGIRAVITPGVRYQGRDAAGAPDRPAGPIRNGQRAPSGMTYLVRDIYFEPGYGHTGRRALADAEQRQRLGRPALLETHRFNFTGAAEAADSALEELDELLRQVRARAPDVRFLSSAELAAEYNVDRSALFDWRLYVRVHTWLRRLASIRRLRTLAWATGLALPAAVVLAVTRPGVSHAAAVPLGVR